MTGPEQGRVFAGMLLCGACMGIAHDLLGIVRRGSMLTAAADLLLGLLGAICVIGAGLQLGCDPFRLYVFIGAALGWACYAGTVGTIVRKMANVCIRLSKKVKIRPKNVKLMQENTKKKRI